MRETEDVDGLVDQEAVHGEEMGGWVTLREEEMVVVLKKEMSKHTITGGWPIRAVKESKRHRPGGRSLQGKLLISSACRWDTKVNSHRYARAPQIETVAIIFQGHDKLLEKRQRRGTLNTCPNCTNKSFVYISAGLK